MSGTETVALLSLGGNLGDRKSLIDTAVVRLGQLPGTRLRARSSYYRTVPVGPVKQDWFLNIAVALATGLAEKALADACRGIEAGLGRDRTREIVSGPRPIDIDVVAYGAAAAIDSRSFVLVPLAEIAPSFAIGGTTIDALARKADAVGVVRLDWSLPPT